jgi:AcrR family transcriptional regulator
VPRRNADTREEIREVALELFATKGFEQTSLREIAERLDITKAALYYHFPSKDELLSAVVEPLVTDIEAFLGEARRLLLEGERRVLEAYFDLCHRHRLLFQGMLQDLTVLARVRILPEVLHRRAELDRMLVGSDGPADRCRAVIALGGLQDCAVLMGHEPVESYRAAAVDAALRALLPGALLPRA